MKRGRNQRRRQGMNPNRALDSNGPEVRIRGTASQIYEKYQVLARDASSSGDRIKAENYLQHAEHYYRLVRSVQPQHGSYQDQPYMPVSEESVHEQPSASGYEQPEQKSPVRARRKQNGTDLPASKTHAVSGEGVQQELPVTNGSHPEKGGVSRVDTAGAEEKPLRRRRSPRRPSRYAGEKTPGEPAGGVALAD